jgi:hypothetical protein
VAEELRAEQGRAVDLEDPLGSLRLTTAGPTRPEPRSDNLVLVGVLDLGLLPLILMLLDARVAGDGAIEFRGFGSSSPRRR